MRVAIMLFTFLVFCSTAMAEDPSICTSEHGTRVAHCPRAKGNYDAFNTCYRTSLDTFKKCVADKKAANAARSKPAKMAAPDPIEFVKAVACSFVPIGTCELVGDAEDARNVLLTHRAVLSSKFCGTINFASARQMLNIGDAPMPSECRALLDLLK